MTDQTDRAALENVCFLALRRPAMMFGVPATGCLLNLVTSEVIGSWIGLFVGHAWEGMVWSAGIGAATHLVLRLMLAKDHNMLRTKFLGIDTRGRSGWASARWGGSSLAPLPGWPTSGADFFVSFGADDV